MNSDYENNDENSEEEIKGNNGDMQDLVKVDARELIGKFRSKADIYDYLTKKWQLFLPPYDEAKISYLKGILNGSIDVIKSKEVVTFNIPRYQEMSVKHLWSIVKTNETLMKYFPTYAEGKIPSSKFFFGVLGTVMPDFLDNAIEECVLQRNIVQENEDNEDYIEITKSIYEAICRDKWISKSHGRGIYLLKKSSKINPTKRVQPLKSLSAEVMKKLEEFK